MKGSYKIMLFEVSVFYGILMIVLPLIYAVTYHLAFISVFNLEWFSVVLFLYPLVLLVTTVYYGYQRMKTESIVRGKNMKRS